ncbi:MAG TPA: bifunctional shikimate kinase/3-dehydroquinate synthase [Solirubrobacteraceae bacterium]|jgi:shikimate kinase/3-dehydroquinate synthase|nr:bifunctional shikimate kinase/3-dehydroquinate synthase [Solirubrobacteraceae bacterium]
MEEIAGGSRAAQNGLTGPRASGALVFIGFMGAGKSTAAGEVADALGLSVVDSDAEIERRHGVTIASLFAELGEQGFREIEERVVLDLLGAAGAQGAVSLGGGSVLSPRVQQELARHVVVLLDVDAQSAWERAHAHEVDRPLARDWERFAELLEQRGPIYIALADAILPARVPGVGAQAAQALGRLRAAPAGTKMLWASSVSGSYPVLVRRGLVTQGLMCEGVAAGAWPLDRSVSCAFCVTDANVGPLYGQRLGALTGTFTLAPGESHKTLASAQTVWEAMVQGELTRADHVVALGGGVVGDLAGFCAATYQRGIPHVQVPTTVVAQVDSAYGGKTGVDLPEAKNYVGAYHQPSGVIVDPDTLASLPPRELSAGWVEVLKTGLIAGGELWQRVQEDAPLDERTILLCAQTKVGIVAQDERDSGARQTLNLGHTIGHAIETVTGYERYLHGEAVGLGLLAALRLSGAEQLREQVQEMMRVRGLPARLVGASAEDVVAATRRDKKRLHGEVPFVLVDRPGAVQIGHAVPEAQVRAAVAELCADGAAAGNG